MLMIFCGFKYNVFGQGILTAMAGPIHSPPAVNDCIAPTDLPPEKPKFKFL